MRRIVLGLVGLSTVMLVAVSAHPPAPYWLWNVSDSAPKGLYARSDRPIRTDDWVVVSSDAPAALWIAERGYLAPRWPLIKQVRGLPGDEICRVQEQIIINGVAVATALKTDGAGRALPMWQGCLIVPKDGLFLLGDHPRSLDGRYFGVMRAVDVTGYARLILPWGRSRS